MVLSPAVLTVPVATKVNKGEAVNVYVCLEEQKQEQRKQDKRKQDKRKSRDQTSQSKAKESGAEEKKKNPTETENRSIRRLETIHEGYGSFEKDIGTGSKLKTSLGANPIDGLRLHLPFVS